jgi:hypothetical protein
MPDVMHLSCRVFGSVRRGLPLLLLLLAAGSASRRG